MAPRTHAIQTPGEAPAPAGTEQPAVETQPTETQPPEAPVRRARKAPAPAGRMAYRDIPADQIDPSTLRAPVLSRDGWVCPSKAPADPREGV